MISADTLLELLQAQSSFSAIRAQGAGGQNVNKVSSAVHLRFDIAASTLPEPLKARLLALQDQRITDAGVVVIKAQSHRSQDMNRAEALQRLAQLVRSVERVPRVRRATRPTYGSTQRRLEGKSQRAQVKAARGKKIGLE
jgi:ribosome-associated protein